MRHHKRSSYIVVAGIPVAPRLAELMLVAVVKWMTVEITSEATSKAPIAVAACMTLDLNGGLN